MKKAELDELKKLSFEDALEKLEEIVACMEDGNLPLDKMINSFENGNALSNICGSKLKELEKKIELLVKENESGGEWQEFRPEEQKAPRGSAVAGTKQEKEEDSLF